MKNKRKNLKIYQIIFVLVFFSFMSNIDVLAADWQEPTCDPPDCNVTAPLNQGVTAQFKKGGLHVGTSTTMGGYLFSVEGGGSYFQELVETIGGIKIETSAIIQGGAGLTINDSGILSINATDGGLTLSGSNIDMITAKSGAGLLIRNDNDDITSSAIVGYIGDDGTAIYGRGQNGIGVFGLAGGIGVVGSTTSPTGLAGRFDGEVRFNSAIDSTYAEINGGIAIFDDGDSRRIIITPPNLSIDGNFTTYNGNIEVITGLIDMYENKIVRLADPEDPTDAVNLKTLVWETSGNNIYNKNTANVGIGTNAPDSILTVDSGGTSIIDRSVIRAVAQGTVDLVYNTNGKSYGIHVDMFPAAVNYAAAFMNGNVGIGTDTPGSQLHIYSTGAVPGETDINLEYDFTGIPNGSTNSNWILRAASAGGKFHIIDSATTERLTIDSAGNVGIGTAVPGEKLDVKGNAKIQGDLIVVADTLQVGNLDVIGSLEIGGDITISGKVNGNLEIDGILKASTIEPYCGGGTCPVGETAKIEFDSDGNLIITLPLGIIE